MSRYSVQRRLSSEERTKLDRHSDIIAHLLFHRGFADNTSAEVFLAPNYDEGIHDPFLLKDAEKSANRIIRAIQNGEKIAIYSDYDADGIPGAAIWHDFFGRIGFAHFILYIPHRHDEGFGLNIDAIEELASQKVSLVVTVDCGISDVAPVARANELGIEVIITDHHEAPPELPKAFAIIDHKQIDCGYPDKNLCGSGVAFKLIQAILKKNRFGLKEGMEKWLLDLVGLATLSDMVSLIGENRILAHYGLSVLRKSPRKGLSRLLSKLKISQKHLTEDDVAFMVTPRINAASRMGVPMDAFKLLTAMTDEEAESAADHLDAINNERKGVVASLVKEIKHKLRERESIPLVIVMGNPEWRPSLLGLAANSCAEEFRRPVFLWGRDGSNVIKGSCRSEGESNVVELMRAVPVGVLTQFGGHHHSGGFAVANEHVHFLEKHLNEGAEKILNSKSEENVKKSEILNNKMIDMELSLDLVDWNLINDLSKLAPFGIGNPKPLFLFKQVKPLSVRRFGKANDHIELVFEKSEAARSAKISAISFFGAEQDWAKKLIDQGGSHSSIDLVASVEKSMFRGRPELRLRVEDVLS